MLLTLKQARRALGFTQDEMADLLGVHVQTYRKIESNPDVATIGQAKAISKKLGMDYNCIFFGDDSSLTRKSSLAS